MPSPFDLIKQRAAQTRAEATRKSELARRRVQARMAEKPAFTPPAPDKKDD